MASELVYLKSSVKSLQAENEELKQRVVDLATVVKNIFPIVDVFYNSVASTSNVTQMYGFLEVAAANVDAPLSNFPATLH
jgi:hypothetical protein